MSLQFAAPGNPSKGDSNSSENVEKHAVEVQMPNGRKEKWEFDEKSWLQQAGLASWE